jgi:hypothetical protein
VAPAFLREIPEAIPAETRGPLTQRKHDLDERLAALRASITAYNAKPGVKPGSPEERPYREEAADLDKQRKAYRADDDQYKADLRAAVAANRSAIEASIPVLKRKIETDAEAIKRLGFDKRADEFEEWVKLAASAQQEREKEMLEALVSTVLVVARTGVNAGGAEIASLNPRTASEKIVMLKEAGVTDPYFFDAIRALGRVQAKPEMAEKLDDFLRAAQKTYENIVANEGVGNTGPDAAALTNAELKAGVAVLGWGLNDPKLEVLVNEVKVTTALVYESAAGHVSARQVERLYMLTEQELKGLHKLGVLLNEHVAQLHAARSWLKEVPEAD